jgi:hypothetical protein
MNRKEGERERDVVQRSDKFNHWNDTDTVSLSNTEYVCGMNHETHERMQVVHQTRN